MAIEKTIFTGTSQDTNRPEVYAWLAANAAEYFDEITHDESAKTITCKIGGQTAILLTFDSGTSSVITLYLKNGTLKKNYKKNEWFEFAVKTSKGIYLKMKSSLVDLFVTRDNNGSVAFAALLTDTNTSSVIPLCASFESSASFWNEFPLMSSLSSATCVKGSSLTALVNMPCWGGVYLPDLYFVPFTENVGLNGRITSGGEVYYYDGIFALKE